MDKNFSSIELELLKKGYVVSPNNIHSFPGRGWYAGRPNLPELELPFLTELRCVDNQLVIYTKRYYNLGKASIGVYSISGEFKRYNTIEQYFQDCNKVSSPGLPAFLWGD